MNNKDLAKELRDRGFIAQEGGGTLSEILAKKRKIYLGVDPTADSMQMGHLVPIFLMKHLYDHGHEPHLLVGGATGLIGDPKESGERPFSDPEVVAKSALKIRDQLSRVLEKDKLVVFDNSEWLGKLPLIEFLRDIGKHFSINQLIKRDIIKRRLDTEENSISFTEFSYSLLQAYDYMYLNEKYDIDLQVGGSDQWANIISGVDLIRRKTGKTAYALTVPIIVDKTTGIKFGKSEGNSLWLDPEKTSPFAFYQFWINVGDENVEDYLKIFTFIPLPEIAELAEEHKRAPQKREAQRVLAKNVTSFVHGVSTAISAEKVSGILYGGGLVKLTKLSDEDRELIIKEVPSMRLSPADLKKGVAVVDVLVGTGLATSKAEAGRAIDGGGVSVNGESVIRGSLIGEKHFKEDLVFIKKGKKVAVLST